MTELYLSGRWPLADVLVELARRREVRIVAGEPDARPLLRYVDGTATGGGDGGDGDRVLLPDGDALSDAVLAAALRSIGRCFAPAPAAVAGTVLRPAAGLCGPARHGPVDAVRTGYVTRLDGCRLGLRATCRVLDVQHTRCWVTSLTFTGTVPLAFTPDEDVEVLSPVVARDTARTSQYMLDRGEGFHWRSVALAGRPVAEADGSAWALAMFTEAHYLHALLDTVLRTAGRGVAA
jgi:hypothetical protein